LKIILFLIIIFFITSCNPPLDSCKDPRQAESGSNETTECLPEEGSSEDQEFDLTLPPDDNQVEAGLPSELKLFGANVSFYNFTSTDMDKVHEALIFIQRIVRTEEFRNRVMSHRFEGRLAFANNNGLTNAQIYQKIVDGVELLKPEKNHAMDLELELYTNNFSSTVGYTYPHTLRIWMNRRFFNRYSAEEVARNIFHEWTHKLGFDHDSSATARRPYSVPYALGSIIQEMAFKLQ
jgi:hypothetical protein